MPEPPDLAATNGAAGTANGAAPRMCWCSGRRLVLGALVFAAAWTVALIYSVPGAGVLRSGSTTRPRDRRGDVRAGAARARSPAAGRPARDGRRARARITSEDTVFTGLIARLRGVHPGQKTPAAGSPVGSATGSIS